MKKIICVALIGVVVLGCLVAKRDTDIIRFHVKANSNSVDDQNLKLEVRDEVIAFINPLLEKARNTDHARSILQSNITNIEKCAAEALQENGSTYSVKVSLGNREFPTRYYDGVRYGQGVYEALMVEIGEAEGENWWCVAYPKICYVPLDRPDKKPVKRSIFDIIRSWFN